MGANPSAPDDGDEEEWYPREDEEGTECEEPVVLVITGHKKRSSAGPDPAPSSVLAPTTPFEEELRALSWDEFLQRCGYLELKKTITAGRKAPSSSTNPRPRFPMNLRACLYVLAKIADAFTREGTARATKQSTAIAADVMLLADGRLPGTYSRTLTDAERDDLSTVWIRVTRTQQATTKAQAVQALRSLVELATEKGRPRPGPHLAVLLDLVRDVAEHGDGPAKKTAAVQRRQPRIWEKYFTD